MNSGSSYALEGSTRVLFQLLELVGEVRVPHVLAEVVVQGSMLVLAQHATLSLVIKRTLVNRSP